MRTKKDLLLKGFIIGIMVSCLYFGFILTITANEIQNLKQDLKQVRELQKLDCERMVYSDLCEDLKERMKPEYLKDECDGGVIPSGGWSDEPYIMGE